MLCFELRKEKCLEVKKEYRGRQRRRKMDESWKRRNAGRFPEHFPDHMLHAGHSMRPHINRKE